MPIGTKAAAEKWGCLQKDVLNACRKGEIPGAKQDKKGSPWHIPDNAECPDKIKRLIKKRRS